MVGTASLCHFLNDLMQAVLPAVYPLLSLNFSLSYAMIGWITLTYQATASFIQPWVGHYTDRHPVPLLLPLGMLSSCLGIGLLSIANTYPELLIAAVMLGIGSSIFHPEASRLSRLGSGGKFGLAQSLFQVGGNTGSAVAPLLTALLVIPNGQPSIVTFIPLGIWGIWLLAGIVSKKRNLILGQTKSQSASNPIGLNRAKVIRIVMIISVLVFAKFVYIASFTNFYTFYLIERFGVPLQSAQVMLFFFLLAIAVGTFAGGPLGDRMGRKSVIGISFLGATPFSLLLPHANFEMTIVFSVFIGLIMSSAFSALVVYAQESVPHRVGMISGIMYGFMFGVGGSAAAGLGYLADTKGITWVYEACAYLPLSGIATLLLPGLKPEKNSPAHLDGEQLPPNKT